MHTESVIKMLIASLTKGIRGKLIFLLFITIIVQSQNVLISYVMGIIVDGLTSMKFSWVLQVLVFVCILIIAITALLYPTSIYLKPLTVFLSTQAKRAYL